ncbi:D-sedoheptulose 7-phosphate isomerase [Bacteroidales bacterium]
MIQNHIRASLSVKQQMLDDARLEHSIRAMADCCVQSLRLGGKLLFCGNGGSAADAQHLSAELSGRYRYDRPPLFAEALHVNTSFVTAVANDYHYDKVFARMVEAMGKPGDVLVALSTSGNSRSILNAAHKARELNLSVIGFSGETGGELKGLSDFILLVPSADTALIQEAHIMIGHILCELIEQAMFPKNEPAT